MHITNELINEIRNKTNIVDVISNYVHLDKRGKNYFGVCPFHDDHSPSMSVSTDKQIYRCFSCGASGNVFNFVSDYEHIDFYDAVKLLGEKLGYNISSSKKSHINDNDSTYLEIYNIANKFYQNNLNTSLGVNAMDFLLNKRKLDKETIKKFGIGLSIPRLSLTDYLLQKNYAINKLIEVGLSNEVGHDLFTNRVMFPLYDLSGNVVGFSGRIYNTKDKSKYINTKETELFKKGNLLYNYHNAKENLKKSDYIIVMEGFMDVIRASMAGVNNCVATMGTALTDNHILLLRKLSDNIILCFDGDDAGDMATTSAIELLKKHDIEPKIIRLEEKDPDEYIIKRGSEAFLEKIKNPLSVIEYLMGKYKQGKNMSDVGDISKYIDMSIKELVNTKDKVLVELTLKRLSTEYNISYENLIEKYDLYYQEKKTINLKIPPKIKKTYNRYGQAQRNIVYYMARNEEILNYVRDKVTYFPDTNIRLLVGEMYYYYDTYGVFNIADFLSYIHDKEEINNVFLEIINSDLPEIKVDEEVNDYIKVINEYLTKSKIEKLEVKLKEEINIMEKAKILDEIMKLKGVKQ